MATRTKNPASKKAAGGKVMAKKVVKKGTRPTKKTPPKSRPPVKPSKPARAGARGRPSAYSEQMARAICGWIKQGYTLRQIAALANMPSKTTIINWLDDHDDFLDQYARAKEIQAFVMEDEIQEIADDSRNDWMEREGKDGGVELVPNEERISRARLRIDSRKWLMGKMAPKRYGDRVAITGKDGGAIQHTHDTIKGLLKAIDGSGTGLPDHVDNGD